eukprot:NODE_27406_length_515_cov_1.572165.p5 GENE.NODE_27406_length_515_cov_1.572165~~NODE_27406_length_515_cov_1.572165.p5  ORF type:complete len:84 (+),score=0.79 NODE_27406_length_515_cov_1.572165:110-361(+)
MCMAEIFFFKQKTAYEIRLSLVGSGRTGGEGTGRGVALLRGRAGCARATPCSRASIACCVGEAAQKLGTPRFCIEEEHTYPPT